MIYLHKIIRHRPTLTSFEFRTVYKGRQMRRDGSLSPRRVTLYEVKVSHGKNTHPRQCHSLPVQTHVVACGVRQRCARI